MSRSSEIFSRPISRRKAIATLGTTAGLSLAAPYVVRAQSKPAQLVVATGGGKLDDAYKASVFKTFTEKTGIPHRHDRQSRGQAEGNG